MADSPTVEFKKNAFGVGSPSWNMAFPTGNLTAAEILAYLPHWLKSVDVVDRFVANGGRSHTVAAIINQFRYLPGDSVFRSNSAQIMMSYGMRRAGYAGWKVGTHHEFDRPDPQKAEGDLDVSTFRPPRETHPKGGPAGTPRESLKVNEEAKPIDFKDLALHVKKHPSGDDALDLARCVQYALTHQDETWLFPTHFQSLLNKLGGPAPITTKHHDRQVFKRREKFVFPPSPKSTPRKKRKATSIMPQSRRLTPRSTVPASPSPLKRMISAQDTNYSGNRRKSGRLANKPSKNFNEYESDVTVSYRNRSFLMH